ncbi:MAG: hypothetical protein ISS80_02610 [Candidatus Cloacimonetes bacterium]|nr:hypothetical protein [Candidatus Cloacimonadota bacterium]MBL7148944.1 hypothetical protein [Candidatus Cloacimonadota bacterium]
MNESKKQIQYVTIIRWIARIWSILSLAFLLLFFGASIISSIGTATFAFKDVLQFVFFPIGLTIGLILAWKWEGLGGIIAIGSIIGFHLQMLIKHGKPDFVLFIELLTAPGILFVLYWILSQKRVVE